MVPGSHPSNSHGTADIRPCDADLGNSKALQCCKAVFGIIWDSVGRSSARTSLSLSCKPYVKLSCALYDYKFRVSCALYKFRALMIRTGFRAEGRVLVGKLRGPR